MQRVGHTLVSDLAAARGLLKARADLHLGCLRRLVGHLDYDGVQPGTGAHLGDARAHQAAADDAYLRDHVSSRARLAHERRGLAGCTAPREAPVTVR